MLAANPAFEFFGLSGLTLCISLEPLFSHFDDLTKNDFLTVSFVSFSRTIRPPASIKRGTDINQRHGEIHKAFLVVEDAFQLS